MIEIRPIQPHEVQAAKHVILSVAYRIYGWPGTLEDSIRHFEETGEFKDMDHVQSYYFDNNGYFLVALDEDRVIGSGGIRKVDSSTAELKRMWLLEEYHGRGIGYNIILRLFDVARERSYRRVVLQTGLEQSRAIAFYQRVGFVPYHVPGSDAEDVHMEIDLARAPANLPGNN